MDELVLVQAGFTMSMGDYRELISEMDYHDRVREGLILV